jgi:hypothetical protein
MRSENKRRESHERGCNYICPSSNLDRRVFDNEFLRQDVIASHGKSID